MEGRGRGRGRGRGGAQGSSARGGARSGNASRASTAPRLDGVPPPNLIASLGKSAEFEVLTATEAPKTFPDFPHKIERLNPFQISQIETIPVHLTVSERNELAAFFAAKKPVALTSMELVELFRSSSFFVEPPAPPPEIEKYQPPGATRARPLPSGLVIDKSSFPAELFPSKTKKSQRPRAKKGDFEDGEDFEDLLEQEKDALDNGEESEDQDLEKDLDEFDSRSRKRQRAKSDTLGNGHLRKKPRTDPDEESGEGEDDDIEEEEEEEEEDEEEEEEESSMMSSESEDDWKKNDDDDEGIDGGSDYDDGD